MFVKRFLPDHGNDLTTDTDSFMIGNRVFVGGVRPGRITFIGEVHFAPGEWAGVVLDEPEGLTALDTPGSGFSCSHF